MQRLHRIITASITSLALMPGMSNALTLDGSTVTAASYCCVAPTEPNRQTDFATAKVGNQIEFGEFSFNWFGYGYVSWGGTIDVKSSSILLTSTETSAGHPSDPFEGFVLTFSNAPRITNAVLDISTTLAPRSIAFTSDSITFNVSGLTRANGDFALIDLTLAPVPEAPTGILMALGLGALVARRVVALTRRDG